MGMAGNWARVEGCKTGNMLAWSAVDSAKANTDYTKYHDGWHRRLLVHGQSGCQPHYNGTATEASAWGAAQAADALGRMSRSTITPGGVADIELPGIKRRSTTAEQHLLLALQRGEGEDLHPVGRDRADFNGFANYITAHSSYKVSVYSSAPVWNSIFGTGSDGSIRTPTSGPTCRRPQQLFATEPTGFCLHNSKTCARLFGGRASLSKYALMWQWSGGGGIVNKWGSETPTRSTPRG